MAGPTRIRVVDGLFLLEANHDFPSNTILGVVIGAPKHRSDLVGSDTFYSRQIDRDTWFVLHDCDPTLYARDSADPNCFVWFSETRNDNLASNDAYLVSRKDISKGDTISISFESSNRQTPHPSPTYFIWPRTAPAPERKRVRFPAVPPDVSSQKTPEEREQQKQNFESAAADVHYSNHNAKLPKYEIDERKRHWQSLTNEKIRRGVNGLTRLEIESLRNSGDPDVDEMIDTMLKNRDQNALL